MKRLLIYTALAAMFGVLFFLVFCECDDIATLLTLRAEAIPVGYLFYRIARHWYRQGWLGDLNDNHNDHYDE